VRRAADPSFTGDSIAGCLEGARAAQRHAAEEAERHASEARALAAVLHDLAGLTSALAAGVHQVRGLFEAEAARLSPEGRAGLAVELDALEEVVAHVRAVHVASRRGTHRDFARPQPMAPLVDAVVAMARGDLPAGVQLSAECPSDLWTCADAVDVRRILLNLVRNAAQAMDAAGMSGDVRVLVRGEGDEVVARVIDEGPGVPPEAADRIFDRCWTSKSDRGGQGLGLAICRELAGAHGGGIALDPRTVRGAAFELRLPRVRPEPWQAPDAAEVPLPAPQRSFFREHRGS
jgi:signal transduction histidine kinase